MTQDHGAAAFFARISTDLMSETEEEPTLQRVAERAVEVVPAVDHCGISIRRRRRRVATMASTSDLALVCDQLQYQLGEGPCLEAIWENDAYLAANTRTDKRWPKWGPRVAHEGVGSVLSIRLATESETLGALNLYAGEVNAFTSDDVDIALIYATHATNALRAARLVSGLETAVQSRHMIGVAQGVIMHSYGLSMDQSFEVLRRYSSHANIKLRDLAKLVIEQRRLPDDADLDRLRQPEADGTRIVAVPDPSTEPSEESSDAVS